MINPKIFHYFKKTLKWEIIIICASFAFITPWHTVQAWGSQETVWNGNWVYVTSPDAFCREPGRSSDWGSTTGGRCLFDRSGNSPIYPDGYRWTTDINQAGNLYNPNYDLIKDDQDNYYPGHPSYTPPAPDISSCTLTKIPINIGKVGSPNFPDLEKKWTDADGCQYQFDLSDPGFIMDNCDKDPQTEDVYCEYKVEPYETVPPPTEENPDLPEDMPSNGEPVPTPVQEDTKQDLLVDWESWEPNPPHQDEFVDPDKVITITLPDGGTVEITIGPDGKISIDPGDYSPNEIPIIKGPNGYPQPNPGYSPPGGGSPGGSGPSGGSPDGPIGVPGVGGTGGDSGGDGNGDGDVDTGDYSYQSPPGKDDLYTKTDKTFESVINDFITESQQAPFISAATDFFDVSTSGTCPIWTIPSTAMTPAIVIDMQCSQVMNQVWPFIAAIILALAGFVAFRWAFL